MPDMTITKALLIFGIKNNYTEEELKKRYRELVKLNHPDHHMDLDEDKQDEYNRKTQDINEAYELLKKNLTKAPTYTYETSSAYWSNQSYQGYGYYTRNDDQVIYEMKEIKKKISSYFAPCPAEKLKTQVSNLILDYIIKVDNSKNPQLTLINFQIDLEKKYRNYIDIYSKKHKIPQFIIQKRKFNYDCDCAKLFNQLKECERTIEFDFSKTNRKFQYHDHYKILESKILEEKNKIREEITYNTTNQEYKKLLNEYENLVNKMILEYTRKYAEYIYALKKLSKQLNPDIKKYLYNHITEIILNSTDDEITQILIDAIEESNSKIDLKEESSKDNNEENINELLKTRKIVYKELKEKFLIVSTIDILEYETINKLFTKAVELLYSETCTMDIISKIEKITFDNPQEEYEQLIEMNQKNNIISDEFICINRTSYELDDKICKAKSIHHKDIVHYAIKNNFNEDNIIDEKTFKENYITIDEFLKEAIFLGYKEEGYPFTEILYYDPKTQLTIIRLININNQDEDTFVITETNTDSQNYKRNRKTDIYQNKAYLKESISKYFDREYGEYNNKNKSR